MNKKLFDRILIIVISVFILGGIAYGLNLSRVKTWGTEVLTAADLNAEFDNILSHSITNTDISASAAIALSKIDGIASTDSPTFAGLTITGAIAANGDSITSDGVLVINATSTTSFNDESITNVGDIKLDSLTPDGTGITINDDGSNGLVTTIDNDGTNSALLLKQDGLLASGDHALDIVGAGTQIAGYLMNVEFTGSATTDMTYFSNTGTGHCVSLAQGGVLATNKAGLFLYSAAVQNGSGASFIKVWANNASTTAAGVLIDMNGTGDGVYIDHDGASGVALDIDLAGSGVQIDGAGDENLSNSGVWTDRSSTLAEKEDVAELSTPTYTDKLKGMKLYKYKKKSEIYGNKENGKYPKIKKREGKEYIGLILDDPTTPEELISRDLKGRMNGKSGTQIAEFCLVVIKELITRIEVLEEKVAVLEAN